MLTKSGDSIIDDIEGLRLIVTISVLIDRKLYLLAGSYIVTDTVTIRDPIHNHRIKNLANYGTLVSS